MADIYILGLGILNVDHMTRETERVLRRCSEVLYVDTGVATQAFFRQHDFFGLDRGDVFFLTQGTVPAIGLDGKLLLAEKGALGSSPNGHGGSLLALPPAGWS